MAYEQLKLQNQLCFRLYTASRLICQAYEPYLKPLGLTYTQYLVLLVLWEHDGLSVNDIGRRLYLGVNTLSPLLKRMERQGLLTRAPSAADRRQLLVALTPQGRALQRQAAQVPGLMGHTLGDCQVSTSALLSLLPGLDEILLKMGRPSALAPATPQLEPEQNQ